MMRALLIRGMLVGVLAGLLSFGVARLLGEPELERAIAFEEQQTAAAHAGAGATVHDHGSDHDHAAGVPVTVSRATQSGIGLLTAILVYGAAFGGLFALVFGLVYGRVGPWDARTTALLLAAAAFITISFVPSLKYPASPPTVGLAETIGARTQLFFAMIAIAVAAMIIAVLTARRLLAVHGAWNAALAGGGAFLAMVIIAALLMPSLDEVPQGFPADVLWSFRQAALAIQATLWATLGLVFGSLADSVLQERQ
jgi:Probable cobalt transporter subunit (CbtA)